MIPVEITMNEAIQLATSDAITASDTIIELANKPLGEGETPESRAMQVFRHALAIAYAFRTMNEIGDALVNVQQAPVCTCGRCRDSSTVQPSEAGVSRKSN